MSRVKIFPHNITDAMRANAIPPLHWLFPPKKHPEDNHPGFVAIVRLLTVFWVICTVWSASCLWQLARTARYRSTHAVVSYGALEFVVSRVSSFSYDFTVNGRRYTANSVMIGGRNLGTVPNEGEIRIWYDPDEPSRAVIYRRLAEPVYGAIVCALLLPFLIRRIWVHYV